MVNIQVPSVGAGKQVENWRIGWIGLRNYDSANQRQWAESSIIGVHHKVEQVHVTAHWWSDDCSQRVEVIVDVNNFLDDSFVYFVISGCHTTVWLNNKTSSLFVDGYSFLEFQKLWNHFSDRWFNLDDFIFIALVKHWNGFGPDEKVGEPLGLAAKLDKLNFLSLTEFLFFLLVKSFQVLSKFVMNTLVDELLHGELTEIDTIDKPGSFLVVDLNFSNGVEVLSEE